MITGIIIGIFLIIAGIKIVSAISQDSTKGQALQLRL
jgi:hypothetical protein